MHIPQSPNGRHSNDVSQANSSLDQAEGIVRAGLRLPWISGQAEGQVNRQKLLKRSMYGCAKLDLVGRSFLLAT